MPQIITITFSPCIDKSTAVPELIAEKKLKCTEPKLDPGGGGINVSRAIKKLGGDTLAIFPSGGYTGKFFNHLLEIEKIPSIIIESTNETRENIIVFEEASENQFRFGMPGTFLNENEWTKILETIEAIETPEYIVASGSLPPGVPTDIYARISKIAKRKNAKYIVDTSGDALKHAISEGVYLIKPNLGELSSLTGVEKIELDKVESLAQNILQQNPCEIIVVSLGKEGAILVTKNETHNVPAPDVPKKSTVGAGDSMLAGIVYSISNGMDLKKALQYGVSCGTAATMNRGTELFNKRDADHLFKLISDSE